MAHILMFVEGALYTKLMGGCKDTYLEVGSVQKLLDAMQEMELEYQQGKIRGKTKSFATVFLPVSIRIKEECIPEFVARIPGRMILNAEGYSLFKRRTITPKHAIPGLGNTFEQLQFWFWLFRKLRLPFFKTLQPIPLTGVGKPLSISCWTYCYIVGYIKDMRGNDNVEEL